YHVMRRIHSIRAFRQHAGLRVPYWPAVVFATRPLTLGEIVERVPSWLESPVMLRRAIMAFRGARIDSTTNVISERAPDQPDIRVVTIGGESVNRIIVAVPSFRTSVSEWKA